MTTQTLRDELSKPFSSRYIEWRVGATNPSKTRGQALPYMTARAVQDRLDDVVGPGGWEAKYRIVETEIGGRKSAALFCAISLLIDGRWVTKEDAVELVGADEGKRGHIDPVKAAVSDALKRAAVLWGLGRYLYEFNAPWVDLKDNGRTFVKQPCLPAHLLPEGEVVAEADADEAADAPAQAEAGAAKPEAAAKPAPADADRQEGTVEKAGAANDEAALGSGDALSGLDGTARETAKSLLERARTGKTPVGLLLNYLEGAAARKLFNPQAREALAKELMAVDATKKEVA